MPPSRVHFIVAGWGHSLVWALETQIRDFAWTKSVPKRKEGNEEIVAKRLQVETPLDGAWTLAPVQVTFPWNAPGQVGLAGLDNPMMM